MERAVPQTLERTAAAPQDASQADPATRRAGLMSLGGILAALGTGACCVVPFALSRSGSAERGSPI